MITCTAQPCECGLYVCGALAGGKCKAQFGLSDSLDACGAPLSERALAAIAKTAEWYKQEASPTEQCEAVDDDDSDDEELAAAGCSVLQPPAAKSSSCAQL